ncbi:Pectin lyase-like superfamily protein [Rhynchospora pubera]|uniref:Pectin lyase-like superfamily protein n=1 Tax=Rhynchospora pubera TaxID=906938 RepID=A0AAV8G1H5_9POAL|nr:Pectin lyase-like superfamily protein [Rhynchospora pubera]
MAPPPLLLISLLLLSLTNSQCLDMLHRSDISDGLDTFSVTEYGAIGDGKHYDTAAIQAAIDACHKSGGGRVLLPSGGDYLTATVRLKSGVTLVVQKGARLLGGTKEGDYPKESARWYVVLAENATGVGITGGGEINGQGGEFVVLENERKNVMVSWNATGKCLGDECRPRLVGFLDSKDVKVSDLTLNQPAYWCLHLVRCHNSWIHNISIFGDFNTPNNDGIDIEDSNNTRISKCHIDTGDDAICPKSSTGPVIKLTVTDCWIRTKSSAIKFGSASYFDFRQFLFDNITIVESHRGLAVQIRDGGNVRNIVFSNIKISTRYYDPLWWGRAEPIYITSCPRFSYSKSGSISNIRFENISAVSENGIFLSGTNHGLLRDIKFKNVNLTYKRWTKYPGGLFDYRPDCQGLVKHNTAGLMVEHVSGLDIQNVNMKWSKSSLISGWGVPLYFRPNTVDKLSFHEWQSEKSLDN